MRTRFEQQLKLMHIELIKMGGLCEQAISLSAKAIKGQGKELASLVFRTDMEIDEKEREIETLCMRLLLQQQPVAKDLREISAALKMISDMERIGDQAADIADLSQYISEKKLKTENHIGQMAEYTVKMVTESVDAFVNNDLEKARKVIEDDDMVDSCFNEVKEELAILIEEKHLDAKEALDLLMAAKYFERIGDHAVNIAEWVEYAMTGIHRNNEHQMLPPKEGGAK